LQESLHWLPQHFQQEVCSLSEDQMVHLALHLELLLLQVPELELVLVLELEMEWVMD